MVLEEDYFVGRHQREPVPVMPRILDEHIGIAGHGRERVIEYDDAFPTGQLLKQSLGLCIVNRSDGGIVGKVRQRGRFAT